MCKTSGVYTGYSKPKVVDMYINLNIVTGFSTENSFPTNNTVFFII